MNKRELNISTKKLYSDSTEDKILKSPPVIPDRGVKAIFDLKTIQETDIAYYDIAPTENNAITSDKNITINTYQDIALHSGEGEQKMGEINDI